MLSHRPSITNQNFFTFFIDYKKKGTLLTMDRILVFFLLHKQKKGQAVCIKTKQRKKGTKEYSLLIWRKKEIYGQEGAEEEYIYGLQHSSAMKK